MICYLDTSLLIKLYIEELDSPAAIRLLRRADLKPMISWLSEVEMSTAIHAKAGTPGRGPSTASLTQAYREFRIERAAGSYLTVPLNEDVFDLARVLGESHGMALRIRALDTLHVAAALQHGAKAFATYDHRQAQLAEAAGLILLQ